MKPNQLSWVVRIVVAWPLLLSGVAQARGHESADLSREIDSGRAAIVDLERVDERRAASDEIAVLKTWYDEAGNWLAKKEFDRVREVLDRCNAGSEMIRQETAAAKAMVKAGEREDAARALRETLEHTKQQITEMRVKKQAMEMNAK